MMMNTPMFKVLSRWQVLIGLLTLSTCLQAVLVSPARADPQQLPQLSPQAAIGKMIFEDESLSASGRMSCQTCHDPTRAHSGPGPFGVMPGGPQLDRFGFRKSPSIRYLKFAPEFSFQRNDEGELVPVGGFFWDGRANSLAEQAMQPFLNSREMANESVASLARRLRAARYASQWATLLGPVIFGDDARLHQAAAEALASFQRESPQFAPFDSKFDLVMRGQLEFTPAEKRGLELFRSETKGNCAACHVVDAQPGVPGALFTDFTYDALGVPRNRAIPENSKPGFFDLGLCGPARSDFRARKSLCGLFKVPSLRNVALTAPYFHNGAIRTLSEAVRFYVRRDTHPDEFYPKRAGKFDDLPVSLHRNVNVDEVPYGERRGGQPRLDEREIADVVSFLETLTDGFSQRREPALAPRR